MKSNHAKPGVLVLSVLAASKSVRGSQKRKVEAEKKGRSSQKTGHVKFKIIDLIVAWLTATAFSFCGK